MRGGRKSFGVVGGLGAIAGADVFFKLVAATCNEKDRYDIVFEQHPFREPHTAGAENSDQNARKLYVFDQLRRFEQRKIDAVILPCFISHVFLHELKSEVDVPIVDMMAALRWHLQRRHPGVRKLGVLTSDYVKKRGLFERYFNSSGYRMIYPGSEAQKELMKAIYGPAGAKRGCRSGEPVEQIGKTCDNLLEQGAEIILPGFTEVALVFDALRERNIPLVDANQIYVRYALSLEGGIPAKNFKVGVIGGVGPAATVAFLDKIVRNTKASKDQEHIQIIVEHNPKIPDRTENLVAQGTDPTVALYAACKRLEAAAADMVAIPCNTAHAFVDRIQPYLSIPIVNMLFETIEHVKAKHGTSAPVGLLATNGTIASGVYHAAAGKADIRLLTPNAECQARVMDAIYGKHGVKAGCTKGACRENLRQAMTHLVRQGAQVILLGCTELPLVCPGGRRIVAGRRVDVVDPAEILALKCVSLAREAESRGNASGQD